MKRKATYQLKRSPEFTAQLILLFLVLLLVTTASNSCNGI